MQDIRRGIYRHFKGNLYEVLSTARHSETGELMVVYRDVRAPEKTWVRPASMWEESVTRDGVTYTRFTYLSSAERAIYDISQEVFSCCVYPGDPAPARQVLNDMGDGGLYNLTAFSMCAHNGTHVDAPAHFIADGKTVDALSLNALIGRCYVAEHEGVIDASTMQRILDRAMQVDAEAAKRILIRGRAVLGEDAARLLVSAGVVLYGNESQTVGPEDAPMAIHLLMLGAGIVLLEGIRLSNVSEGGYFLCAAPINLGGAEGAPCRAVLLELGGE